MRKNERNVASHIPSGSFVSLISSPFFKDCWRSDLLERYAQIDIENPSAKRFANQSMRTTFVESPAPIAHATTAKVVTAPSIPP